MKNYVFLKFFIFFLIFPASTPSLGGASSISHPWGQPQSPKVTKNTTMFTRFNLAVFLVRKEGNSPLKTIKCLVFLICPTLVPSLGGASLICHLSGPPQSPKVSKNTIKITSFCHAVILMSKEANSLLKAIKCLAYLSHPVTHLSP